MLDSKPGYVRLPQGDKELYEDYGPLSIEEWHKKKGLYIEWKSNMTTIQVQLHVVLDAGMFRMKYIM